MTRASGSPKMEDVGLELNLVSAPVATSPPLSKRKKRGDRFAWDKKAQKNRGEHRRNISPATPKPTASGHKALKSGTRNVGRQTSTSGDSNPPGEIEIGNAKIESQGERRSTGVNEVQKERQGQILSAATAESKNDCNNTSNEKRPDPATNKASLAHRRHVVAHGNSITKERGQGGDNTSRQPPKTKCWRVMEKATQGAAPLPREDEEQREGGLKRTPTILSSEQSETKSKRPRVSKGHMARDGVVDFTDEDGDAALRTNNLTRTPNHRVPAGKIASLATPSAAERWWDDDDDDIAAPKFKVLRSASSKGGSRPSVGKAGGVGVVVDQDGGLPSTVHPNSVRPKRVDMDGEASNAMGILAALLAKDVATGDETPKKVKSRGSNSKDSRKPVETNGASVEGGAGIDMAASASAEMDDVSVGSEKEDGDQSMSFGATGTDGNQEERIPSATPSGDGPDCMRENVTRKNRGKAHIASDGGVPPPEHHARPRELSRRAAAKPLLSKRSAHYMATGPGATFTALGLPPKMVSHLEGQKGDSAGGGGMGLAGPTVCQMVAIPALSAGHNTVIKSETGSGKTLAYLLPMLCDLAALEPKVEREKGTFAIVLAPTRELSSQILKVLMRVVRPFIWLVPGSLSGGERRKSEKARLRKGVTILVCTPGRLLDHLKATKCFRRDLLRWLVLDEADRLLDMGFEKQVKEIVELLDQSARAVRAGPAGGSKTQSGDVAPSIKVIRRQTVLVSATLAKGVSRLATILLSNYMRVDADKNLVEAVDDSGTVKLVSRDPKTLEKKDDVKARAAATGGSIHGDKPPEEFSTPRQLVQHYMTVTQKLRLPALCAFLRAHAGEKVVVFMSTCDAVDFHHDLFRRAVWPGDATPSSSSTGMAGCGDGDASGNNFHGEETEDYDRKLKKPEGNRAVDSEFFGSGCLVKRLHGNVPQNERQATYRAFGASASGVLICTDVAARGLDLPTVDWILQYDPPAETADYVHRVGRTARKGERGHSLLFLLPRETAYLNVLETRGLRPKPLSLEGVLCAADAGKRDARRADEQLAYELQQGLQLLVAGDKALLERARAAFQSHVRAYAARAPDSRAVFQVRSLHLGHVARSFALKDPPTAVKVGKRVVRRPGDGRGKTGPTRGEKRRRDGAGGMGGGVHRLGLSKRTEAASRSEFL